MSRSISFEQAVYGSFAFRPDGYAMLAHSPGCREEWLGEFRSACQKIGERPIGFPERSSLFALRLRSGPWCVAGIHPQGCDDKGRPGALAFHALFLSGRDYRAIGSSPFPLSRFHVGEWSEGSALNRLEVAVDPETWDGEICPPSLLEARIADILRRGRKAALEAFEPAEELVRSTWQLLSPKKRARLSLTTWAFGNGNEFDLFVGPRLAGIAFDPSTIVIDPVSPSLLETNLRRGWIRRFLKTGPLPPAGEDDKTVTSTAGENEVRNSPAPGSEPSSHSLLRSRTLTAGIGSVGVLLAIAGVIFALQIPDENEEKTAVPLKIASARSIPDVPKPRLERPPTQGDEEPIGDEERKRLTEALVHMMDRFNVRTEESSGLDSDPTILMSRIAEDLRYRGALLSGDERRSLEDEQGHDVALALQWDEHVRKFAGDRPLPSDFVERGISSQIDLLAWSFHSVPDGRVPRLSPAERIQALAESLAVDVAIRATPMVDRYPPLTAYLSFLGRLPRR